MTAPGTDELADYTAGQLVTWRGSKVEIVDPTGPWLEVVPVGASTGFTVHESEVSAR